MAKIVYRQMPAPRELPQQMPAPRAKARMQKPQGGGKFLVQIARGARGGWLWIKLIPALLVLPESLLDSGRSDQISCNM